MNEITASAFRELRSMKHRLKNLLNTGDRIELYMDEEKGTSLVLEASFEALIDNDKLVIQATVYNAHKSLRSNHAIRLVANKDSAGILEMSGKIIQSTHSGDTSVFVVELAEDIHQTQRRQYFRLSLLKDVRLGNSGEGYFDGVTQNISAGGIRCILPMRMRAGAKITVRLELNQEPFELTGEVLEAMEFDENTRRFVLRIRFIDTSEKDRAKLISYIFSEQSRQKKMSD